jgi:hypothetical protein
MEHVEVAALDRGLRLERPGPCPRRELDRGAVLDHFEGSLGPLQLAEDPLPDATAVARRLETARLVGIAVDRIERSCQVIGERGRVKLTPANGVDAVADLTERCLDA